MMLFGIAEITTGFRHEFFGLTTSPVPLGAYMSAFIGASYATAGALFLIMRKWAASVAVALLLLDIAGRLVLVTTGLYPTTTTRNALAILAGTLIVAVFALYVGLRRRSFPQ
ncbi:MAG: hypothetical protein JO219_03665 [Candidatus Eremiobacteraeota bacterium]|nr:hypothetical protein [Candidatus Eremiobacteraeota bacterium]